MPREPISTKQRYWLRHIKASEVKGISLSRYAASQGINLKSLYQWKSKLVKLGLHSNQTGKSASNFIEVKPPATEPSQNSCVVSFGNGARVEFTGRVDAQSIQAILAGARS